MKALAILLLLASAASAEDDRLTNRTTATAAYGFMFMQIDRIGTSGMLVQPTVTHTFDRFELQADYVLADLRDDSERMAGSILHRIGFAARYQAQSWRDHDFAGDIVVELGVGFEYLERDDGDAFGRTDAGIGIGGRFVTNLNGSAKKRAFMGIDLMFRGLVTPSGDKAFVFAFGAPFGR